MLTALQVLGLRVTERLSEAAYMIQITPTDDMEYGANVVVVSYDWVRFCVQAGCVLPIREYFMSPKHCDTVRHIYASGGRD